MNVTFQFPEGCAESWQFAELPTVPRIGESIQGNHPESGRYRVADVIYDIDPEGAEGPACDGATVVLEATDKINYERRK